MKSLSQPTADNPESLERLWRWLTVPLFLYCAGLWVRSQGDNFELLSLIAKNHDVAVVTGLFATPVVFVSLWLANSYVRLSASPRFAERIPRTLEKGMEGRTGELFRIALFLGIWIVILGSQIHFTHSLLTGSVIDTTQTPSAIVAKGPIQMLSTWPSPYSHDFRFGGEHGPTYFPVVETWCCLLAVTALVASFLWRTATRFHRPR